MLDPTCTPCETASLDPHDHPCLIYESLDELAAACVPFMKAGLLLGERCVYVYNETTADWIIEAMQADGFDLQPYLDRGAFVVVHTNEAHMAEGYFEEKKMFAYWHDAVDTAREAGFAGLRASAEMTWATTGEPGCDGLVTYESKLNHFTDSNPLTVVCSYRRQRFAPEVLKGIIHAHPMVIAGNQVMDNPNFVRPEVFLEDDAALEVQAMLDNLTLIKQLQLRQVELEAQKAFAEGLIQHTPAGIAFIDRQGICRRINPAQAKMWRTESEQSVGRPARELFGSRFDELLAPLIRGALDTGEPFVLPDLPIAEVVDGVSRTSHWECAGCPTRLLDEGHDGVLILAIDVTARLQFQQFQAERIAALEDADRLKTQFLAILSHELRTPLNAILAFGSIIADEIAGPLTEDQRQYMTRILGGADMLLSLINDLLDMSRIKSGKFSLEIEPFELEGVASDVIEILTPMADQRAQTLLLQVSGRLPLVTGDPIRIRQVVMNLVGNAIKFTPELGHITVRLAQTGEDLMCEVLDTGRGVPENQRHKLFRPFSQVDMSDTRGAGGTGLGLSISKALVEAHGGRIGFESTSGSGTTVWFTLPVETSARCAQGTHQ